MQVRQLNQARSLKAKGWGLRQIGAKLGVSHEAVRQALAQTPPVPRPKRARAKTAKAQPQGSLLDVSRALLAELRRRARATQHPALQARFTADATTLGALVLRLEASAAKRADGLLITQQVVLDANARVMAILQAELAKRGPLECSGCGAPLVIELSDQPPILPLDPEPGASSGSIDAMVAEAHDALRWLLAGTAEAEASGDEVATQRKGRAAVSVAGFVARLERAMASAPRDGAHVSPADLQAADALTEGRITALQAFSQGSILCDGCAREYAIHLGMSGAPGAES